MLRFGILGTLEVRDGHNRITPTAPKLRQTLALLLVRHNTLVQTEAFIDELWGEYPPVSAITTLQTYIYKLRGIFSAKNLTSPACALQTHPSGYMMSISEEAIDVNQFEQILELGKKELDENRNEQASQRLSKALSFWRGPALVDVMTGNILSAYTASLEEKKLRALDLCIETELKLGRHRDIVGELKQLVVTHPLHEAFYIQLMKALHRSGRRSEAMETYQRLRKVLLEELGVDPSDESRQIHHELLAASPKDSPEKDFSYDRRSKINSENTFSTNASTPTPAQLPNDTWNFTGHQTAVNDLMTAVNTRDPQATTPTILMIYGMAGTGKTSLAVHVGHLLKSRYSKGQFFHKLRDPHGNALDPKYVLWNFLSTAGIPQYSIPESLEERSKLFRSWCSTRDILLILDDAESKSQILPLIPGSERCATVITSRSGIYGVPCMRQLHLPSLSLNEGMELLAAATGIQFREEELLIAERIITFCEGNPFAIRAAATRITAAPARTLHELIDRLADPRTRLRELNSEDFRLCNEFDREYHRLSEREKTALFILGLSQCSYFTLESAMQIIGCDRQTTEDLLHRLVSLHFIYSIYERQTAEKRGYRFNFLAESYIMEIMEKELRREKQVMS